MQLQQDRGRLPSEQTKRKQEALQSILRQSYPWGNELQDTKQKTSSRPPSIGTIDIEKTCAIIPPKEKYDVVIQHQSSAVPHILLLLDASTSITPQQKNLIFVLAFALYHNPVALTISMFSTTSTTICTPQDKLSPQELFERIHSTIKPGYTHLHEGMKELERQYIKSSYLQRYAVIISDGMSNYGPRPHHKDFFLPNLLFLCLSKRNKVFGFSPSVTRNIQGTHPISIAFQSIRDVIIEQQHEILETT